MYKRKKDAYDQQKRKPSKVKALNRNLRGHRKICDKYVSESAMSFNGPAKNHKDLDARASKIP